MTIEEGLFNIEALQRPRRNQEAGQEVNRGDVVTPKATAPEPRKRAPPKCRVCGSIEHGARTCPCK